MAIPPFSNGPTPVKRTVTKSVATIASGFVADYYTDGTADDVQIQAALDSLPSTGGEVKVRLGQYDMTAAVTVPSHVTISGEGLTDANQPAGGGTIFKRNNAYDGPIFTNSDYIGGNFSIIFRDFAINGNKSGGSPTSLSTGIYGSSAQRVLVFNVSINNTKGDGIHFLGTNGGINWVSHSRLRGCGGNGITFGSADASDCAAWNNEIGSVGAIGISLASVANCILSNNFIFISGAQGIDIFNSSGIVIADNRVNDSQDSGIRLSSTSALQASGCTITGNKLYDNNRVGASNGAGIYITDDGTGASVNNVITGNVSGNIHTSRQKYGILTDSLSDYNTIVANNCSNNVTTAVSYIGTHSFVFANQGNGDFWATTTRPGIVQLAGDLAGTYAAPTLANTANVQSIIETIRLDQMAAPTASVAMNSQKIIGLANGTNATDAAAFGQVPTSLPPSGAAGGGLAGTYPNPTVATNANLTGPITSVGNATSIASQTGTGTKFVVDTSPTLVTPNIGAASGSSLNLGTGSLNTVGNIEIDGSAARDITVARSASGAGVNELIQSGGALSGATDTNGGDLQLKSGISTGNGTSPMRFYVVGGGQGAGTTDRNPAEKMNLSGNNGRLTVGMGATVGTTDGFQLGGNVARTIQSIRHTTANTAGNILTVTSGGATSGATDKASGDLILSPGLSTGTGGANVRIQTMTRALSTGTADNIATDRIIAQSPKSVTNNSATTVASMTNANGGVVAGRLSYTVEVTDGTDFQYETGVISYGVTNKAGAIANNTVTKFGNQQAATAGTLTVTWTITAANPALIQVNANSSLTPSTGYPRVTYVLENLTQQAVTIS